MHFVVIKGYINIYRRRAAGFRRQAKFRQLISLCMCEIFNRVIEFCVQHTT